MTKQVRKKTLDRFVVGTLREVAAFFGVTTGAIRKWRDEGCPGNTGGGWDLAAIAKWRTARVRADTDPEMRAARLRLAEAAARSRELENGRIERELIPRHVVDQRERERARAFASVVARITRDLLPRLEPKPTLAERQFLADAWLRQELLWLTSNKQDPPPDAMSDDELIEGREPAKVFHSENSLINYLLVTGRVQEQIDFRRSGILPKGVILREQQETI